MLDLLAVDELAQLLVAGLFLIIFMDGRACGTPNGL